MWSENNASTLRRQHVGDGAQGNVKLYSMVRGSASALQTTDSFAFLSERAPDEWQLDWVYRLKSVHEPQEGLDSNTDWLLVSCKMTFWLCCCSSSGCSFHGSISMVQACLFLLTWFGILRKIWSPCGQQEMQHTQRRMNKCWHVYL